MASGLVCASATSLQTTKYVAQYEPVLKSVPALELPAKSAGLVMLAKPSDKEAAATAILQIISKLNPSALPTVVGAISHAQPDLTAKLTLTAAQLQPKLSEDIRLATIVVSQGNGNGKPPGVPDPEPTDRNGKKKGHYKGTPDGPPGQLP